MISELLKNISHVAGHPFSKGRRIKAVIRFVRWQFGSRLALGPVVVDFVNNAKLCVSTGMTGATGNIYTGLAEFDDMAFVLHVLRPGDLFVDIGANVGTYTVLATTAGANVLAFEPALETYDHLCMNIRINDLNSKVTAINAALGRRPGILPFTKWRDTTNHIAATGTRGDTEEIPVTTLDVSLQGCPAAAKIVIKIDVEGYETEALAGASLTLERRDVMAVIMELNGSASRYGFDEMALHNEMIGHGFSPCSYDGVSRQFTSLESKNSAQGNTIYLRDVNWARNRVVSSGHYTIQNRQI